jgi:hypothetical protein
MRNGNEESGIKNRDTSRSVVVIVVVVAVGSAPEDDPEESVAGEHGRRDERVKVQAPSGGVNSDQDQPSHELDRSPSPGFPLADRPDVVGLPSALERLEPAPSRVGPGSAIGTELRVLESASNQGAATGAPVGVHDYSTRDRIDPSPSRVSSTSPGATSAAFFTTWPSRLVML